MTISEQSREWDAAFPLIPAKPLVCHAQVILGSPSNGCNGVGICRIYMTSKTISSYCTLIRALLTNQENGHLRVGFIKNYSDIHHLRKHFSWQLFQVQETFELPGWTQRKLPLTQVKISPGIYTVWETDELFVVDFWRLFFIKWCYAGCIAKLRFITGHSLRRCCWRECTTTAGSWFLCKITIVGVTSGKETVLRSHSSFLLAEKSPDFAPARCTLPHYGGSRRGAYATDNIKT